jgi:polyhydroxyalkanoate synthesis regulator phasin
MSSDEEEEGLRTALRRLLNPLDFVVITRDRLQDALDDAVRRGRMTRDDATDLLGDLMRRARRQTDELLSDLADSFPIRGYDDLTAAQVIERLRDLEPGELRQVRDYERRNANRKTVLGAVDTKLGQ